MNITVKLYASLGQYLPSGTKDNTVEDYDAGADATASSVISKLGVPAEMCHLVLVNGVYLSPSERDDTPLKEGDVLAMWPPVAGG